MTELKPTHVYIGRKPCGCVIALTSDYADKTTGKHVAEFISDGLAIDRIDWDKYKDEVSQEPTFLKCPHGRKQATAPMLPGLEATVSARSVWPATLRSTRRGGEG